MGGGSLRTAAEKQHLNLPMGLTCFNEYEQS